MTPTSMSEPTVTSTTDSTKSSATSLSKPKTEPTKVPSKTASKSTPKPKREHKPSVDTDAEIAAKLQAELNRPLLRESRAATTTTRKRKVKKRGDDDDQDEPKPKRKVSANNPFMRPVILSPALSDILGQKEMARPHVVKALWDYIKENNLQNPNNKKEIICDDRLCTIFGPSR